MENMTPFEPIAEGQIGKISEVITAKLRKQKGELPSFSFGGVVWVEDRSEMPAAEARLFPTDVPEMFVTFLAPSKLKFGTVNKTARDIYYFEKMTDENGQERFEVVGEPNFVNACMRPQALVAITIKA